MKHFGVFTLLLAAVLSPLVSARLTLLRLAQGDQPSKLRGLSSPREASPEEAHLAFRELMTMWTDVSMSVSMSMPMPPPPPLPVEIPGFDFSGYYSMSMSMSMPYGGPGFGLGDTIYFPGDGTTSGGEVVSLPTGVDDAGSSSGVTTTATSTGGTDSTAGGDGADTTTAENLGKDASSTSSGASTPQTVLMVVLVGAALAVMSALYVRKNQRAASSNASQMTPMSAPLV